MFATRAAGNQPDLSPAGTVLSAHVLQVAAVVATVAAGTMVASQRVARSSGFLLIVAGFALCAALVPPTALSSSAAFTAVLLAGRLALPTVLAATLAYPFTERNRAGAAGAVGMIIGAVVLLSVLPTTFFDPRASGCNTCPPNLATITNAESLRRTVLHIGDWAEFGWSLLAIAWLLYRSARAPQPLRRVAAFPLAAVATLALAAALLARHDAVAVSGIPDTTTRSMWIVALAALTVAATAVLTEAALTQRRARGLSHTLIAEPPEAPRLGAAMQVATRLPMDVVFARADGQRIGTDGRPHAHAGLDGHRVVVLQREGDVFAECRFPAALRGLAHRAVSATRVAALALEHAAASARLRAELLDMQASRLRIVERADEHRHLLERNLHDGAQQALLVAAMTLQSTDPASLSPDQQRRMAELAGDLRAGLAELREIARGIFPPGLAVSGLPTALRGLAQSSPGVEILADDDARGPRAVEATAFRLAAAAAAETSAGAAQRAQVRTSRAGDTLLVEVAVAPTSDGVRMRLRARAEDRVAALGGTFDVRESEEALVVSAVIPCGS
jgi:signal transduction histidine kinase